MHLKKLEICGFKSFARRTEVIFEKGVTCIVGPNGCGKSNISDAIRWVLGERSAKMLRGAKMEDVIFQGTDSREPINFAEVTLTIDNTDHALPIQFDEVSITRRLHRSGESEYLLNKTICRLKDIQNIILDTGIGSNSYSMIEQGRIDYILNAEAEERRFLIEEAAGISKFKVKKEEAIRKLEQTEQNLLRLNDIVAEVERNIKYAERQSKRAEQYKVHYEKLKALELAQLSYEINELNEKKKSLSDERTRLGAITAEYQSKLTNLNEQFAQIQNEYRASEDAFFKSEHDRIQFEQKVASIQNERQTTEERFQETKNSIGKNAEEIQKIDVTLAQLETDLKSKQNEFESIQSVHTSLSAQKLDLETKLNVWHEEVNERSLKLFEYKEKSFAAASELARLKNEHHKAVVESQTLEERKEQIADDTEQLKGEIENIDIESNGLEKELSDIRVRVESKSREVQGITSLKLSQNESLKRIIDELSAQKERKFELVHKLELLTKLDGASFTSIQEVLAKYKQSGGVFQTVMALLDLLEINDGFEVATAAALADFSKAVVAEDAKSAVQILEKIYSEGHHQVSILVRNQASSNELIQADAYVQGHSVVRTRLLDVVRVKNGYEKLFNQLLGDVYVVNDITIDNVAAYEDLSKRARLVSQNGIFIGKGFQLSLRNGSPTPLRDFISREQEKTKLKEQINESQNKISQIENQIKNLEGELTGLESGFRNESHDLVGEQLKMSRIESAIRALQDRKKRANDEIGILREDLAETTEEAESCAERISRSNGEIASLEESERELKSLLEAETKWTEERKLERETKLVELTKAQTRLETHEDFQKRASDSLALMRSTFNDLTKRTSDLRNEQIVLAERIQKLEALAFKLESDEKEFQEKLLAAISEATIRRQKRDELSGTKSQIEEERSKIQEEFNQIANESHVFEKKELELEHQKSSAIERIKNTYRMEVVESELTGHLESGFNSAVTIGMIEELKKKVDSFGTVNLLAIEEYQELKTRFDFLSGQRTDLEKAREELLEAIRKINRTTKQLFEETFVKVRENFTAYFKLLFQGGTADLTLVDETNPLDSGIDIIARPPGKKPQHISLLSGGEKALTATALLFALFRVKPSPFCVLDEIDAPLDESNNERLVRVLREFVSSTQFIIVTHSRKTIAMADSLYGVTMEEAGISKLVSVKVSKDATSIEHSDAKVQKELNAVIQQE